ncbi:MAG: 50S ribosomal protein L35 [candidate division Zixibacteria bacterium 4484_93]|nr:50S ribosomal protein L35 [Armatimonadota bacterium]OQX89203.1 MAG: 50S ribosomal protein L35 [candidate division Zixibacteria bacterium 4484_93]
MPKLKTNKSAAKRFKLSGSGKIMRFHAGKSHKNGKKSGSRLRRLRGKSVLSRVDTNRVKRIVPHL